ncbi:MAG: hypothetical protein JWM34_294 [Ilumatobacteraceae bacterium]|nr:hypothetical protein [Ilumatobacteraceae bacterium]
MGDDGAPDAQTPAKIWTKTSAVLLAAGAGSRFRAGSHKLIADLRGRPVIEWALDAVIAAGCGDVIVVTGAVEIDLARFADGPVRAVHNPRWAAGQATSLHCGLAAAAAVDADAVVVGLGDQPFVLADSWRSVAAAPTDIAVATYAGRRANPVLLRRAIWDLLPTEGDEGARSLIGRRPDLVSDVACSGSPADIDTMEDLQQWNSSTNSP